MDSLNVCGQREELIDGQEGHDASDCQEHGQCERVWTAGGSPGRLYRRSTVHHHWYHSPVIGPTCVSNCGELMTTHKTTTQRLPRPPHEITRRSSVGGLKELAHASVQPVISWIKSQYAIRPHQRHLLPECAPSPGPHWLSRGRGKESGHAPCGKDDGHQKSM